jgi:2-iminoacetate synthase ThiH
MGIGEPDSLDFRELMRRAGRALRSGKSEAEFLAGLSPRGMPAEYEKLLRRMVQKAYRHAQSTEERMRRILRSPRPTPLSEKEQMDELDQLMENHQRLMAHFK